MLNLKHLPIDDLEADAFCAMLAAYLPSTITELGRLRPSIGKMLTSLDELASPEIATERAEHFGIADHKLLEERVLLKRGGRIVTAGLRFKKLNIDFPFVQLCANFQFSSQDILEIRKLVRESFASFSLKGITLRHPPNFFSEEMHEKWSHIVFGQTANIPWSELPSGFQIRREQSVNFYSSYESEFKKFLAENPDKDSYLSIEDEEDLNSAATNGLLMSLWDAEGWAGVIAAKSKELYGLPCAYIFEIFLAGRVRGRRLGRFMQAQFLSSVADRFPYVYGHINDANKSSLKTAFSQGRKIIETEYFFPFAN